MAFYIVKVGNQALGAVPLFQLTGAPANYVFFANEAGAEAGRLAALEKYPMQSLDGYSVQEANRP